MTTHAANADQAKAWNGAMGQRWVERQAFMDRMLAPVADVLFDNVELSPGLRVIDIGCGSGETTLRLAANVAPDGHATGLDISAPLLARARERTSAGAPVTFIEADATVHPFTPGDADLLFSRFGVMFFAEPAISFANMRKGLRSGAKVCLACWRAATVNQWLTVPMAAVRPLLPPDAPSEPTDPEAPGPYAFADDGRVRRILGEAGFDDIGIWPVDLEIDCAAGGGTAAAVESALEIGPVSRGLARATDAVRAAATESLGRAFAPFEAESGTVMLGAAIWLVTATNH